MTYEQSHKYCQVRGGFVAFFENENEWISVLEYLWSQGYDRNNEIWIGLKSVSFSVCGFGQQP